MYGLPFTNKHLAIAVKIYAKADTKIFWSCPVLLISLHFSNNLVWRCLCKHFFAQNSPQSPWNLNISRFFMTSKTFYNHSYKQETTKCRKVPNLANFGNNILHFTFGLGQIFPLGSFQFILLMIFLIKFCFSKPN